MLRSSQQPLNHIPGTPKTLLQSPHQRQRPPTTPILRKARSGSSLGSPGTPFRGEGHLVESSSWRSTEVVEKDKFVMIKPNRPEVTKRLTRDGLPMPPPLPGDSITYADDSSSSSKSQKRHSFQLPSMRERAGSLTNGSFSSGKTSFFSKAAKLSKGPVSVHSEDSATGEVLPSNKTTGPRKREKNKSENESPDVWARWLAGENTFTMDVGKVKRLRMLLRHESTA